MIEAKVDEVALRQSLREMLADVPVATLERAAAHHNLLAQGGYRKGGNPELLRTLFLNTLGAHLTRPSKDLASFARTYLPVPRLLALLSRDILVDRRAQLTAFFGKPAFILGLFCDTREESHTHALAWMEEEGLELPSPDVARDLLAQAFAPVVTLGGDTPGASANRREAVAELRKQLEAKEKELRQLRRDCTEQLAAAQRETKSCLATAQFGIDERQRRIEQLEAALQKADATVHQKVKDLLAVRQVELFQGWLKPAFQAERLVATDTTAPLLERAQEALEQQAKYDRASSVFAQLEERLHLAETMLERMDRTLANASARLPALIDVRAEVAKEVARLREMLNRSDRDPLVALIEARLVASTDEEYSEMAHLLEVCRRADLIGHETGLRLLKAFQRRAATWTTQVPDIDKDAEAEASEGSAIERRNPALTAALRGQGALILFLDGHNILNGLGRYKQRRGTAITHEEARQKVAIDVSRLFRDYPQVAIHLVWDGTQSATHNASDNVIVHFSGGEGEHRADRYILDQIAYTRKQSELPIVLVTDDNGFAGEALKLGAAICKLHDFAAFLNTPPR